MRVAIRLVVALVALVAAVGCVLTAIDVGRWQRTIERGDRASAANPARPVDWAPATLTPFDPAARLVGLRDDVALRRAIRAFVIARHTREGFDNGDTRNARTAAAAAALESVALSGNARQAAQADVLLGVLAFGKGSAPPGVPDPAEQATGALADAARADPQDVAAKFNLELVVRAITPKGVRPGSNPSTGNRGKGTKGAGAGLPGKGF
jgi:hypothetical protein